MRRTSTALSFTIAVFASLLIACSGGDGTNPDTTTTAGGTGGNGGSGSTSTASSSPASVAAVSSGAGGSTPFVCDPPAAPGSIYEFEAESFDINQIDPVSMCKYRGEVLLIVNTAAKCGYTPQYAPLEALEKQYKDQGLHVLGFLSNDFLNQGGTQEEVEACNAQYGVTFEQFATIHVKKGPDQHPLFQWLTSQQVFLDLSMSDDVTWNFNKWLVARDGTVVNYWTNLVYPGDDPSNDMDVDVVTPAIDAEINK